MMVGLSLSAAIVSIVLACLNNMNKAMPKGSQLVSLLPGAIATLVTLNSLFNVNKYMSNFGGYGISISFGLILAILASIALVVTGLLAMSGGKITKRVITKMSLVRFCSNCRTCNKLYR